MLRWMISWFTPLVALLAYLLFWPVPIDPVGWAAPPDAGYTGDHAENTRLAGLTHQPLGEGEEGPEFILANGEWLYTGLADGQVLRFKAADLSVREPIANTGGRPLGLDIDAQGRVWVADAMKGLLRITGSGDAALVETVLTQVDQPVAGDAIRYADAVKVAPDGSIWLTDASRRFGAQAVGSTFEASVLDILEASCTGRVIMLPPGGGQPRVVLDGLCFPNGLVFSGDAQSLLLAETGTYRIVKVPLSALTAAADGQPPRLNTLLEQGRAQVLLDNLPGYPDNLTRAPSGRIWVGLTKPRSKVIDALAPHPVLRSMVMRLPRAWWPVPKTYGHIIAFDDEGRVVLDMQDPAGGYPETTSATEADGRLFVQSLHAHTLAWRPFTGVTPGRRAP